MALRMTLAMRVEARRLFYSGVGPTEVGRMVGCSTRYVYNLIADRPYPPRHRNPGRLSLAEREEIAVGRAQGESRRSIARRLGRSPSTVSREVKAQGAGAYRAWKAEGRAERLASRPKPRKLDSTPALAREIETQLGEQWSPQQISRHLREKYPDTPGMQVCPETIYKTLYLQGRGSLRKELARHLRTGRPARRSRARAELRGRIPKMVNISQRPPEVEDRAVPGHWEGDLIMGQANRTAIGTLVERKTRFVMLLHLPDGHGAEQVRQALTKKIQTLPESLRQSLTWDQGYELAQHLQFTVDTGVQVYFCDPHSPWQRGTNENTNGLLRQYFPKGEDLSAFSEADLDLAARKLNTRPRQTLGWKTPSWALNELLR